MYRFIIAFLFLLPVEVSAQSSTVSTSVWLPQNSGLAFVNYKIFTAENNYIYVITATRINILTDSNNTAQNKELYHYDTLETYSISQERQQELVTILVKTDSLGYHMALGCIPNMGWPRFLIKTNYHGHILSGYVANCYREHIYQIIDVLNKIYPTGDVLNYDKNKLLLLETDCNKKMERVS